MSIRVIFDIVFTNSASTAYFILPCLFSQRQIIHNRSDLLIEWMSHWNQLFEHLGNFLPHLVICIYVRLGRSVAELIIVRA